MNAARGDITAVHVEQSITGTRSVHDCYGREFAPTRVQHRAYLYKGAYYRKALLIGADGNNVSLYPGDTGLPHWPAPPAWFEQAAARLELEAEELARIEGAA